MTRFITKLDKLRILVESKVDEKITEAELSGRFDNMPIKIHEAIQSYIMVLEMIKKLEQEK